MSKIKKFFNNRDVRLYLGVVLGAIIYSFGIIFILDLGRFYSGGMTGISQLIRDIILKILNITENDANYEVIKNNIFNILIYAFNVPLFLFAFKGVSKKFAIVSVLFVVLQTLFNKIFSLMLANGISPFSIFKINGTPNYEFGSDPKDFACMITLSVIGGLVTGLGCGISLKVGGSTGGIDVISQYLSLKKHISFTKISLLINVCIITVSGIVNGIPCAIYTIIRLIIDILIVDKIYTIYNYTKITIITDKGDEIINKLIEKFNHGITVYDCVGAFTHNGKKSLETVVWSFEVNEYVNICKSIDPNVFISSVGVKRVDGKFKVNVVA